MSSSINTVSGNRVTGLASGMDTESLVEKMLSGTQAKIDKQTGVKQQLEWKQDMVRGIITDINTFRDKYFSYYSTGNTNLLSSSFYNTMAAQSSSSAIKVMSAASNASGKVTVDSITQLATACTVKSGGKVTGAVKSDAVSFDRFTEDSYSIEVTLDGVHRTIAFEKGSDLKGTIDNLNDSMYRNFGTAAGFELGTDQSLSLVKLKWDSTSSKAVADGALDTTRKIFLEKTEGKTDAVSLLGFANETSNKLDLNTKLDQLPFAQKLIGSGFGFEINGVAIDGISASDTLGDVISKINNSAAGVKVSYSSIEDKFIMESKSTGEISNITMKQTSGNLLTAMFGVGGSSGVSVSTGGIKSSKDLEADIDANFDLTITDALNSGTPHVFSMNVDGEDISIVIKKEKDEDGNDTPAWDRADVIGEINKKLEEKYGTGEIVLSIDSSSGTDKAVFSSADHLLGFNDNNVTADITMQLGFTSGQTQKPDLSGKISELGLSGKITFKGENGAEVSINFTTGSVKCGTTPAVSDCTVEMMQKAINNAGLEISFANGEVHLGKISEVTGNDTDGKALLTKLLGTDSLNLGNVGGGSTAGPVTEAGKNAILSVNGTTVERNTNTFEIEGVTLELTDISNDPISLTTSRNTDKIVEGFQSFVEDYNKLIDQLNEVVNEDATYKKYAPLTEAQRKEMSEREIELWEEKAKTGLLRNDSNINSFLGDMRTALYQSVDGAGLALYDIGIETSDSWRDNGKLIFDESKLRAAVSTNLEDVQKLMTDKEHGIGVLLDNAIKAAANVSTGSPGSLVAFAGTKAVLTTDNSLYHQLKDVANTLSNLNLRYESEKSRYWKQFTAMEQAISNLNNQSSWLSQQFSSGS